MSNFIVNLFCISLVNHLFLKSNWQFQVLRDLDIQNQSSFSFCPVCPVFQDVMVGWKNCFSVSWQKKMLRARVRSILVLPTFHIAILNRHTPKFSGVPQKLTWCQQFGLQIFPKWGDADICPLEMAVFRCFFGRNKFSRPNGRLSPIACLTYLESYGT